MVRETRFVTHAPERPWAMVEPADGATATELGELLTQAAKTIKDVGSDLRTHSMAVEWDGEGGEAFRTWCNFICRNERLTPHQNERQMSVTSVISASRYRP
jgi:hypothetical protein